MDTVYNRVLLKLSGEALMGTLAYGIEPAVVQAIAQEVSRSGQKRRPNCHRGRGGNIFRGIKGASAGMDRATADYVGMLATVMNAMTLQDALERSGYPHSRPNGHFHAGSSGALHSPPRHSPSGERDGW
jgi:uridylate kinase